MRSGLAGVGPRGARPTSDGLLRDGLLRDGLLSDTLIEQVRQRAQIVDLFEPGALRKAGREFLARCPWHDDRSPSLTVSPKTNRVHCFVCAKGTDPIGWLQQTEGLTFPEAIRQLAHRYGIAVSQEIPTAQSQAGKQAASQLAEDRRRLRTRRQQQHSAFHQALRRDLETAGPAAQFLARRGIQAATAIHWQLGLAEQRLQLPLCDPQGRCVGFSGRALAEQQPKYRNSSGDALFQKSQLLFGLDRARSAIHSSQQALLVEGPLDVIALHQAGFTNAVATLGTSCSPGQLALLRRCGFQQLLLAYDGDAAGQGASLRLIQALLPEASRGELDLAVVALPAGSDPDGLIQTEGAEAFARHLEARRHWLSWWLDQLLAPLEAPLQKPQEATAAAEKGSLALLQRVERQAKALLAQLPPGVLHQRAADRIHQALGLRPEAPALGPAASPLERAERRALRLYLHNPECRGPLQCLELQTPLAAAAMQWAVALAERCPAGQLAAAIKRLGPELPQSVAGLLLACATPGAEVVRELTEQGINELQAVLDVLEAEESQRTACGGSRETVPWPGAEP